jgi:probable HAF family extracellular repeat protein
MTCFSLAKPFRQCRLLLIAFLAFSACTDKAPTGPSPSGIASARSAGGNGPTVKLTDPDTATVDTTLNVHVFGSGYDQGSRADWAFRGVVSGKIVTNSTQFVSSTELVANITIARNADLGSHDVIVTTSAGKGGIGTELFVVTLKTIPLGTLGGLSSEAQAINNLGQVVGYSTNVAGQERAFLWTKAGGMRDLGTLGGTWAKAWDINDAGQVVGQTAGADGLFHAFLWTEADGMRDIGLGGAYGIAANGDVAVMTPSPISGAWEVFHWSSGVSVKVNISGARPDDVNSSAQVVGYTSPNTQAVLWSRTANGWEEKLLGGSYSMAQGINDAGQVVGLTSTPQGYVGFVWTAADGMKQLPNPTRRGSRAHSISNSGEIAGFAEVSGGFKQASLWSPVPGGWKLTNLAGELKGKISWANDVNDVGQAVGWGVWETNPTGVKAVLWEFR